MRVRTPLVLLTARGGTNLCCIGFECVRVHRHTNTHAHTLCTLNERATFRKWQHFEDSISCFQAWSTYWRSDCRSIRPPIFITEGERREFRGTTIPPSYLDPCTQDVILLSLVVNSYRPLKRLSLSRLQF